MLKIGPLGRPPGPIGLPGLGVLLPFRARPAEFLLETWRQYGDISYFRVGFHRMYLLNRPDYAQEILVTYSRNFVKSRVLQRAKILLGDGLLTSEGEFHLRQRRLVQPAFYKERLENYAGVMVECAGRAQSRWQDGEVRDIADEMMRLTLAIVGRTLFSKDVESEATAVGQALTDILSTYEILLLPASGLVRRLPLRGNRKAQKARWYLDRTIFELIRERRSSGKDHGDLLSMLMLAQDEHGDQEGMSDKQVRDEALTLFLAGHETTATALTWTWYLLSQHPEVEQRLQEELQRVLNGRAATFADLPALQYTEMVLAEAIRLYPPAWAIGRMALRPFRIHNYVVPAKSICLLSPYVMHRHPQFYPDPERFDPERFTPEAKQSRPRFAYFPFGAGPRVCIGERFAWMEGVLVLAAIAQKWRMRLVPGHIVEPRPQITLRTRYGLKMSVHRI
jgi:cytochrome P450